MKPMMILAPDLISADDIKELRDNGLCVVIAKDPSKVKFVDPIPAAQQRGKMEDAAIRLSRVLLNGQWSGNPPSSRSDFARLYVELLVQGTSLDPRGSLSERTEEAYTNERLEEARRLARADAKAEREAKKKAAAK